MAVRTRKKTDTQKQTESKKQEPKAKKQEPEIRSSDIVGEEIIEAMDEFKENHRKWVDKGTVAAAKRARVQLGNIKKAITEYRKATLSESN